MRRPPEFEKSPQKHGEKPAPAELLRQVKMFRRRLDHQGRKDMELSRGFADSLVEGDMLGDGPALRIDTSAQPLAETFQILRSEVREAFGLSVA